jgi:hypothetical protein
MVQSNRLNQIESNQLNFIICLSNGEVHYNRIGCKQVRYRQVSLKIDNIKFLKLCKTTIKAS